MKFTPFYALAVPLVLITTTDTPPYSYRDADTGEIVGLEVDIARDAATSLGRELVVRKEKFADLLPLVNAGKADMAASGITITEGRARTVDFSIPYAMEGGMFLYRAGEPMPTMIRAERMRVGTIDASTYDLFLTRHGIDPIRFSSYPLAVAALEEGRLDTVFFDGCGVRETVAKSGGRFLASDFQTRENYGIAVQKGNETLKAAINRAILSRKKKGGR